MITRELLADELAQISARCSIEADRETIIKAVAVLRGVAQALRVPRVRTSHHRNKEEAARLQEIVAKRYEAREKEITRLATIAECAKIADQTELRCVREKIPGDNAAKFIAQNIRALALSSTHGEGGK